MRNISVALTEKQIRARTKDVTRRLGTFYVCLKPGDLLRAVDKCMGFKKGEHPRQIAILRVKHVRIEQLNDITPNEVRREGFPEMTCTEFIAFFCKHMKCKPDALLTRIEFEAATAGNVSKDYKMSCNSCQESAGLEPQQRLKYLEYAGYRQSVTQKGGT